MVNTINIDAGGTFTDGYLVFDGDRTSAKVPTTAHDLTECFIDCIRHGADELGTDMEALLAETDVLRLATTFGTNTVIERSGQKVGAIVTAGHESSFYSDGLPENFFLESEMIRGVDERVEPDGTVSEPVDREEALTQVRSLVDAGARIIVVALENAAHNPTNERSIRNAVKDRYPQHYLRSIPIHPSTEVTEIPDDRRRATAAVVNAYIHREMARNLYKAEDKVRDSGYQNPLLAAHADGGAARIAKTKAINTYSSGPAAGLIGTAKLANQYGFDRVLATDMGGTSVDAAISRGGNYTFEVHPEIAGVEVSIPMLRMTSIGAGGGSVATVEENELRVGPESAGARPGPACYGLGGTHPTVTDADVVLGYIDPEYFLGGQRELDVDAASQAIDEHVATPLGIDIKSAAKRIRDRVDADIADDIARLSRENDLEPADIDAMFAFGGAGPLHAAAYSEEAGIDTILTFPFGSVFNAFGQSTMDVEHSEIRAIGTSVLQAADDPALDSALDSLVENALRDMEGEGFDPDEVTFSIGYICNSDVGHREILSGTGDLTHEHAKEIADSYATAAGVSVDDVQLEAVRLTASVDIPEPELPKYNLGDADPEMARKATRPVYWGDSPTETPIYQYADLRPGHTLTGPAIIEAVDTTYAIPNGWTYRVDQHGNGVLKH